MAVVSPDLKQMTVAILAFGRDAETLDTVAQFTAATDAPALAEAGESFLIRGTFDAGRTEEVRETGGRWRPSRVKATPETSPLRDASAPVALEIRYDGQPVPLEIRDGKAEVREPREGEKVSFVLRKIDRTSDRYGVVLLVNDVNTLFKERTAPLHARKWILGPDHRETVIHGYQTGARRRRRSGCSRRGSRRSNAVHYGPAAGTITLVVFREQTVREEPPPLDDEAEDLVALSRGVLPAERPQTLAALKFRLREGGRGGLAGPDRRGREDRRGGPQRRVPARPDAGDVGHDHLLPALRSRFPPGPLGGPGPCRPRRSVRTAGLAGRIEPASRPAGAKATKACRSASRKEQAMSPWFSAAVSRVRS